MLWGVVLLDYKTHSETDNTEMWIDFINIMRVSKEFLTTLWNGLRKGDKQNTTKEGIGIRLERIKEFYEDKDRITQEHAIKWKDYNKYI